MKKALIVLATCSLLLTGCGGTEKRGEKQPVNASASAPPSAAASESKGAATVKFKPEQIGQALIDRKYEEIYEQTSAEFQTEITREQFLDILSINVGVRSWDPLSRLSVNGANLFKLISQDGQTGVVFAMNEEQTITGIQFVPLQSFPESDNSTTKLAYGVPFTGEWYVFWGGRNALANYHYEYPSQRYAYDIIQMKEGFSYKGDAAKNESYYAFGQPILAPQGGRSFMS
ncbi:hypothetical protein [Cohnella cholangitidis]|uniref:hypothetical protein n=1 Tax=Cohnella cholangitidis TaxID=2598458 RepID=UPI001E4BFF79|nr:hypothetical protein [Cohnella cholangitidis]